MTKRVLALDPGERVGWARADVHPDGAWSDLRHGITPLREMALAIHGSLLPTPVKVADQDGVWQLSGEPDYDVIVYEEWRLYPGHEKEFIGSTFPSSQFIGMVRLCGWLSGVEVVSQGAKRKKNADKTMEHWRPELFEKVTKPGRHDDQHDLDALRHLWFWTWDNFISAPPAEGVAA